LLDATVNIGLWRGRVIPYNIYIASWVSNVVTVQMVPHGVADEAGANPTVRKIERRHGLQGAKSQRVA